MKFIFRDGYSSVIDSILIQYQLLYKLLKISSLDAGTHPMDIRFMRGVYNTRPPGPKYSWLHMGYWQSSVSFFKEINTSETLEFERFNFEVNHAYGAYECSQSPNCSSSECT